MSPPPVLYHAWVETSSGGGLLERLGWIERERQAGRFPAAWTTRAGAGKVVRERTAQGLRAVVMRCWVGAGGCDDCAAAPNCRSDPEGCESCRRLGVCPICCWYRNLEERNTNRPTSNGGG